MAVQRVRKHGKHRQSVMQAHEGVCHICGGEYADAIDHIVPVAWGGSDDPANLAPAHTSCNSSKGAAAPEAWTYSHPAMWLPGYGANKGRALTRADIPAYKQATSTGGVGTVLFWVFIGAPVGLFLLVFTVCLIVAWFAAAPIPATVFTFGATISLSALIISVLISKKSKKRAYYAAHGVK